MHLNVDLHSHSGASGGVGKVSLERISETMRYKGIDVFGTGDAFHEGWLKTLNEKLTQNKNGLYNLKGTNQKTSFLIQSEIIITAPVPSGGRKNVHTVILLPSIEIAQKVSRLLAEFGVKLNIGRPFLTCNDKTEVAEKLFEISKIHELIEIIPGHVLTPQGIYGSNNPITFLCDFFGDFSERIQAIETGLSADPEILALIPELDSKTLLSSSDCHCGALDRVGREYTTLDVDDGSYENIINSIRNQKVVKTAEFSPAEGRFFLTGHRADKKPHNKTDFCYFSPDTVPEHNICPICNRKLTVGVLQRALDLSSLQGENREIGKTRINQKFFHMVPLVEIIAAGLSVKSTASKKVLEIYFNIIEKCGKESNFWDMGLTDIKNLLNNDIDKHVLEAISHVKSDNYTFNPLGYDGTYGILEVGRKSNWFGHKSVVTDSSSVTAQQSLF
ncbi:MAG: endonuclease Q family protein [Planctomycetota bacterium]|jgi:PHP family Zn ribbon phosphoesterase